MAKISIDINKGTLKKDSYIVGIDLGTTNSLVAYCNPAGGEPIALSQNNATIVPSIVFFDENNLPVVGEKAKENLTLAPERTIYSVKRLLGRSFSDINTRQQKLHYKIIEGDTEDLVKIKVGNKFYSPIDLSAIILRELKQRAEKTLNAEVSKAVITVPAYFNDSQRQATRDAGKMAGLDVLRIINEPTAASLAYGIGLDKNVNKTVAVYDFGGGTFDVSILRIEEGVFEVLSTHGDTFLGGDDFDQELVNFWLKQLGIAKEKFLANVKSAQHLRLLAEKAKKTLSSSEFFAEYIKTEFYSGELRISKDDFEKLITPIIARTISSCQQAIKDAGISIKEIDEVIMVGGSTRVPAVVRAVKAFFEKKELNNSFNPDEVVALGAAIEADVLSGNRKDILLLDVTPLSLGIETLGGLMDYLINRNSKVPCKASRQYTTSKDGQTGININIYQGEREMVANNRKLGEFELKGIPAMPAGLPKLEVTFLLDADGILTVDATELRSGVKQEIRIKPAYGLTDNQVEKMLLESMKNAASDMDQRMIVETRTEAEQLISTTERFMEKNKAFLKIEEIEGTSILLNELKSSLNLADRNVILSNIEKLNEFSRPYAERIMDSAVSQSLKGNKIV